jgi:hypothetical protein
LFSNTVTGLGPNFIHRTMGDNSDCTVLEFLPSFANKRKIMHIYITLNNGDVPKDWKYANVTAIFKKGDRFKASNYRPVALTCLCCSNLVLFL